MIDGHTVVHEAILPASPDDVFDAFVDPEHLVRWIGISADLEPRPGGRFRFEIVPGEFCEGQYVAVERPRRLVVTWGWTDPRFDLPPGSSRVEVTLTPHGDGGTDTHLRLVHHGLTGPGRLLHDEGWTHFLNRLDAMLSLEPIDGG
jgi:uncharacterized protein YndB with AHSA1/START domain